MAQGESKVGLYARDREEALAASFVSPNNGWETTTVFAMLHARGPQ
jgi:hypothetical protein